MYFKKTVFLLLLIIFTSAVSLPLFAQEEILEWVEAPLGQLPPVASYSFSYYPEQDVKKQDTTLSLMDHYFVGLVPIVNQPNKDFAALGIFEMKDMKTHAILPKSGVPLPDKLYNLSLGPCFRYKFDNQWTWGAGLLLGSASDKMFNSSHEFSIRFDTFLQIPASGNNSWLGYIDYYTNREFLRDYPIPGGAYWYRPNDKLDLILGLPVAYLKYLPMDKLTFEFTYIMITTIDAKLTYALTPSFSVYGRFTWDDEVYERADRAENKDRLFYYEKTLSAGIHWQVFKYVACELSGGYSFDRFFFESDSYDNKDDNEITIEDGPFVKARVGFPF